MNVIPKDGANQLPSSNQTPANDKRERAIAALMGKGGQQQSQEHPVSNPSSVSPEEMTAVRSSSSTQKDSSEASPEQPQEATPAPKEEPLSAHYAQLARKEKALRAKAQAQQADMRAKEAAMLAREEAIKAKEAEYQSNYVPKERLTNDTWAVLNEAGLSYEQLAQLALSQQNSDPVAKAAFQKLEAELKSVKQAQEDAKKSYADQQKQAYQQAVNQIRMEAKQLVRIDPAFETIRETNSVDDVVDLIERTFKSDGILLTVEDAAREVEEYLIDEAMKLTRIKKIQDKLSPKQSLAPKPPEQPLQQSQPSKTLTNAVGASRQLSSRERAILAFKGEKKI